MFGFWKVLNKKKILKKKVLKNNSHIWCHYKKYEKN